MDSDGGKNMGAEGVERESLYLATRVGLSEWVTVERCAFFEVKSSLEAWRATGATNGWFRNRNL